jgi:hypothetical protein
MISVGSLCITRYPFTATYVNSDKVTESHCFKPGQMFVMLRALEINELGVMEIEILFENIRMSFNIHNNCNNIENVRRAESYDTPFMTIQEVEPGSNSSSLIKTYSPIPQDQGPTSHTFSFSGQNYDIPED